MKSPMWELLRIIFAVHEVLKQATFDTNEKMEALVKLVLLFILTGIVSALLSSTIYWKLQSILDAKKNTKKHVLKKNNADNYLFSFNMFFSGISSLSTPINL